MPLSDELFRELKMYVGFSAADAANLVEMRPLVSDRFALVVERFYESIEAHPTAYAVFQNAAQIDRLKVSLTNWLETLFSGDYGAEYLRDRSAIGRAHVRVGLPQHFMFVALDVVRQELERALRRTNPSRSMEMLDALHKLLSIESAMMLETYRDSYVERVRTAERVELQERLTQAEHLARIGRLAASLAHEIKNPLAGISGAIQVLRDAPRLDDGHKPVLNEVLRQINRLDGTVKDLLVYARPAVPRFVRCDISQLIERVVTLLAREAELKRVRVLQSGPRPLPAAEVDENQIEQVLINLLLNAAHASHDNGLVRISAYSSANDITIEVEDHGHGMDEETRQRAVEAFFTTKAKGTGLGLPICARIIDRHHGTVAIESCVGKGTVVRVRLPLTQDDLGRSDHHEHTRADR